MAAAYRARLAKFEDVLKQDKINLDEFQKECFNGIPDNAGIRSICWKILLNYLPPNKTLWKELLSERRSAYKQFLQEMIIEPGGSMDSACSDHPLNPNPQSQWSQYFKDNEVLLQIDKDTRRLLPDLGFFQRPTKYPFNEAVNSLSENVTLRKRVEQSIIKAEDVAKNRLGITNVKKKTKLPTYEFGYNALEDGQEAHWEVVERILFIYAKLNPGQGYVQGMNEIIGPIYYIFATDPDVEWEEHAEADTFFCFTNLMSEIRDTFIKTLDHTSVGINAKMKVVMMQLKKFDLELWLRLNSQNLQAEFFLFRWLTLLLSQEFPLPDLIRIWDSLFADSSRFHFLESVCCAMIIIIRNELLEGDFSTNMKLLQNYPSIDVNKILSKAFSL
ncbi:TBC1 domain family member 13-like [Anneissia japonica]|uniref:TBC1 domain family member 13-like n=1 Tax=Anneissia japonica TaxID=1529436 RepID=UPI0014256695|nr:TBC1 domain family member 13-like [Anneissia japonica]